MGNFHMVPDTLIHIFVKKILKIKKEKIEPCRIVSKDKIKRWCLPLLVQLKY